MRSKEIYERAKELGLKASIDESNVVMIEDQGISDIVTLYSDLGLVRGRDRLAFVPEGFYIFYGTRVDEDKNNQDIER